uniref:Adenylate kinase isoenzyme 5 n=1 Tax=Plectus sambesii TaxID=2011161 RepID=A0A914W9I4_9BILA
MGAEAKRYLQEHNIPQLFEGLMTGLIYNKPDDPLDFLDRALSKIRADPTSPVQWDMFIDNPPPPRIGASHYDDKGSSRPDRKSKSPPSADSDHNKENKEKRRKTRVASVMKAADRVKIPDVPIVLFMGGPGGGKTRHAARVREALQDRGLVHICMPDMIRTAIARYKDKYPDWKEAGEMYERGELIPNNLALALVKAEMGRHPNAKAYFLEGYPREARQVADFEREIRHVNIAIILDYDEATLRGHMERRGLSVSVIDRRIREFKMKTLPSAKYFDDRMLLHLIPGEQGDDQVFSQMKELVDQAITVGMPPPMPKNRTPTPARATPLAPAAATPARVATPAPAAPVTATSKPPTPAPPPPLPPAPVTEPEPAQGSNDVTEEEEDEVTVPHGLPNDAPVVLVIGAPGSNKSIFAQKIAKKYDGFLAVSMGNLLREKIKNNPDDKKWARIAAKMDKGDPVPMKICRELMHTAIHAGGNKSWGYVLEGYPRTPQQAQDFEATVDRIDLALLIDCTEQYCVANIGERLANDNGRVDDADAAVVKTRLGLFKQNTLPMLKYFDEKSKLKVVDGDNGIDQIFQDITNIIDNTLFIEQDNDSGNSLNSSKNSTKE